MRSAREASVAVVVVALFGACALAACSAGDAASPSMSSDAGPTAIAGRACPTDSTLTYESFGEPFFTSWCTGCHSSAATGDTRRNAPAGIDFDTLDGIRANAARIYARAADDSATMPPAGGPSHALRHELGDWLACGAPGTDRGIPPPTDDAASTQPPTGACAAKRDPVPTALLPRCAAATRACIDACANKPNASDCSDACVKADPTPKDPQSGLDCNGCYFAELLACADRGCHTPIADLLCCAANDCQGGDPSCLQKMCYSAIQAFGLCIYYVTPECLDIDQSGRSACFARPSDAGPPDASGD
jgi:hypothetical protein